MSHHAANLYRRQRQAQGPATASGIKPRVFILNADTDARALWVVLRNNWQVMAAAGTPLAVTVARHEERRNAAQNRAYWRMPNQIASDAWIGGKTYSAECWHEQFKRQFIGIEELPDGGTRGISTTTLKVSEFATYMNRVAAYAAAELGIILEM